MPRTRPAYPDEFRQEAVAVVRGGRSVRDVAESLGVSQQSLRKWVKQTEYVSLAFGQAAGQASIARSMGSKGDCFYNAVAESFFATLKKELVRRRSWPTKRELTSEVFAYVEAFYNRTRRHSTLGMLSPSQFEDEYLS